MEIIETAIAEVKLLRPRLFRDERGWFAEIFSSEVFEHLALPHAFVQDNQSLSLRAGTLRGLHFQVPPHAQSKLVRVVRGAVFDVVVDVRRDRATFGRHVAVELSAENRLQLLVPPGFAHGFLTLRPETEVVYKVDAGYAPTHERGVHFADPDLALPWPEPPGVLLVSAKDRALPQLREIEPW
jgi:dTDP-4-dehydrorhamnose 3,5-epimerase